jgi:hypothetical protein
VFDGRNVVSKRKQAIIPGFARRYNGRGPHYEVWYGKVDIAPGRALWFRYTTLDGTDQFDENRREASVWAIAFDGDTCTGAKDNYSVDAMAEPNTIIVPQGRDAARFGGHHQVFHLTDNLHLDEANAIGQAGDISWDLSWTDSNRRFSYVPHVLARVGLAKSTYDDCLLDLRVSGTIRCGDTEIEVDAAPGMVGHIQGKRIMGHSWAWSHCNCFDDDPDAAFEGLSVRALLGGRVTPKLSAFVMWVDGRQYTFRNPIGLLLNNSEYGQDHWVFSARSGGVVLTGEARSPSNVALVEYTDTDGSHLWCYNSKLSDLEVRIQDPSHGLDRTLRSSGRAAFEHVNREEPAERPIIE